jgi:hypothetical protein
MTGPSPLIHVVDDDPSFRRAMGRIIRGDDGSLTNPRRGFERPARTLW